MNRYSVAPSAVADLDEIWLYIAQNASVEMTWRFIDSVTNTFPLVAANPGMGRLRPNLGEGMRCFPIRNYRGYYRQDSRGVVRILHVKHAASGACLGSIRKSELLPLRFHAVFPRLPGITSAGIVTAISSYGILKRVVTSMNIEITRPEVEELIQQRLRTGAFASPEDVILDALRSSACPRGVPPQLPFCRS